MAAADTARLVAELSLDARGFNAGVKSAQRSLGNLEGTAGKIGGELKRGVGTLGKNLALIGVGAAGAIALAVKGGLDDLSKLEDAITSVDGAISQMGLTGQVTGKQVSEWANQIEADIGAAFDDKEITAAASTLIRFGKVTTKNLKPALVVMTDLATKTGDVDSAASLLAKALADPTKAAGKLSRQGIILTKAEQDQIKALTKAKDIAGAQAVVLDAVARATKGAAAASQGPYQRALSQLNDVAEDARKALAEGFLPVIQKVAERLSKATGDPKFINGLREFGNTLASGLDSLIDIAVKLPWQTIGDSLKIAGAGAKAVLEAFTKLPPWIQTAVLTGWGLNKLTGGALGNIVSSLASGLIKGVLGINAGVVNINAAVVNGAGGVPGAPGAKPGASGITGVVKDGLEAGFKLAIPAVVGGVAAALVVRGALGPNNPDIHRIDAGETPLSNRDPRRFNQNGQVIANFPADAKKSLQITADNTTKLVGTRNTPQDRDKLETIAQNTQRQNDKADALNASVAKISAQDFINAAVARSAAQSAQQDAARQYAAQQETKAGVVGATAAAAVKTAQAQAATTAAARESAAAIRAKKLSVNVENHNVVNTSVSVRETINSQTTYKSYFKTAS